MKAQSPRPPAPRVSPRWHKVVTDLTTSKMRSFLVVLSIAAGVLAVGVIAGTGAIISREVPGAYVAIQPTSAVLTLPSFDEDTLHAISHMPAVAEVDGRHQMAARLRVGDEWKVLQLIGIEDFDNMRVNQVKPDGGLVPPPKHALLLERSSSRMLGIGTGDTVLIETLDRKQHTMRVAGVVHDVSVTTAFFSGTFSGYVDFDTLEWLGEARDYNQMNLIVAADRLDRAHIQAVTAAAREKLEDGGHLVNSTWVPLPMRHWGQDNLDAILLLLTALGTLTLVLSAFLVTNTLSAVLSQQTRQIGVMKAMGADTLQMMGMYISNVLVYGVLALAIAIPGAIAGARGLSTYLTGIMNISVESYEFPIWVYGLQVLAGLVVPLLAAFLPILSGARITVREAITSYGLGKGEFGKGIIDRLLQMLWRLPRPLLLSLRNTVRQKSRLLLTLTTLSLAGAIIVAIFGVRDSLVATQELSFQHWGFDMQVLLTRDYSVRELERLSTGVPGVSAAQGWIVNVYNRVREDGSEGNPVTVVAAPAGTDMIRPVLLEGRWLLPDDQNAIVISPDIIRNAPGLHVGGTIVLKIDARETTWDIVGLARNIMTVNPYGFAYVNYEYMSRLLHKPGKANSLRVSTREHDLASQAQAQAGVEATLRNAGVYVSSSQTAESARQQGRSQFGIIIMLLMAMAAILSLVGGLGLMGTMSINVMERTRELGVLRAVGAADWDIVQMVVVEGVLVGVLSWVIGCVFAYPLGMYLSDQVGVLFTRSPLLYVYSSGGAGLWLGLVVLLAALASFMPAWSASRATIREVLAYE